MRLNPTSSPANAVGKGARDVMAVWKELDASSAIGFQSWSNTVRGYKYVQPIKSPLKISFKKWKQIKVLLTTDTSKFRMFSTILSQETAQGALIHHQAQRGLRWKENKNLKTFASEAHRCMLFHSLCTTLSWFVSSVTRSTRKQSAVNTLRSS